MLHYLEAIRIDPSFADAYSNLGNAYRDTGEMENAIGYYLHAVHLRPDNAEVRSLVSIEL